MRAVPSGRVFGMMAFGRTDAYGRAYHDALTEWATATHGDPEEHNAMAANIRHDYRVEEARVAHFDETQKQPRTGAALRKALDDYLEHFVRRRKSLDGTWAPPNFLDRDVNRANILDPAPNPDIQLGTIFDLSGLARVFTWARGEGHADFADYPSGGPRAHHDWLRARCEPSRERPDWIERILRVVWQSAGHLPFHPTWCTWWEKLEPHLDGPADEWARVLGPPLRYDYDGGYVPRWFIALKYALRDAHQLCRPSILDAGWNAYHFPSPPMLAPPAGGRTVDTRPAPVPVVQLPEFIHAQIPFKVEYWIAAGRRWGATTDLPPAMICEARGRHHALLADEHGDAAIRDWMPQAC
jgi:hypothetical protein